MAKLFLKYPMIFLTRTEGGLNTVQVRGMDASGNLLSGGSLSNYVDFTKAIAAEKLTGKVTVSGEAKGRCRFKRWRTGFQ